jgi:lysophospholipase L1-like esterase
MRIRTAAMVILSASLAACGSLPGEPRQPPLGDKARYRLLAAVTVTPTAVTATSTYGGLVPARAIDGDPATQWSSDGYRPAEASLVLDYGQVIGVEELMAKTGTLPPGAGYVVETSLDGVTWAAASGPLTNTTWTVERKAAAGAGRFVRLRFFNSPTAPLPRFSVFEVVVRGQVLGVPPTPQPSVTPTPAASVTPTPAASGSPTPAASVSPAPAATPTPTPLPSAAGLAPAPLTPLGLGGVPIASRGDASAAFDGSPLTLWQPYAAPPQWLAVPLGRVPIGSILCAWDSAGYTFVNAAAAPRDYVWEASADSTDGRDGTWSTALAATDSGVRSRVDALQAPGARWLRLRVTRLWSYGPSLRGVELQQTVSGARTNAWLILGDSITAQAFDPAAANAFPDVVQHRAPGLRPLWTGGGTGGDTSAEGLLRLDAALEARPPGSYVGLAYGTNDATRGVPVDVFKARMDAMVDRVLASGRTAMVARTPWSLNGALPEYVQAIDAIAEARGLPPGPDLYAWFRSHPEELQSDRVHPTTQGRASIQRLWGEAVARAYGY